MQAKYDIESLLVDILGFMKAGLNTRIAAIETEKNDDIVMKPVGEDSYFLQTLNNEVVNTDPFIFYGVDVIDTDSNGPGVLQDITIGVILVLEDTGEDAFVQNRMLRYLRALTEIFQENWDKTNNKVKLKTKAYPPTQFKEEVNSSNPARAVLISLSGRIPA